MFQFTLHLVICLYQFRRIFIKYQNSPQFQECKFLSKIFVIQVHFLTINSEDLPGFNCSSSHNNTDSDFCANSF